MFVCALLNCKITTIYGFVPPDKRRISFFKETLTSLHRTANEGYPALQAQCHRVLSAIDTAYPALPAFVSTSVLQLLRQHKLSKTWMPSDLPQTLTPVDCSGDGNCLFRYAYK